MDVLEWNLVTHFRPKVLIVYYSPKRDPPIGIACHLNKHFKDITMASTPVKSPTSTNLQNCGILMVLIDCEIITKQTTKNSTIISTLYILVLVCARCVDGGTAFGFAQWRSTDHCVLSCVSFFFSFLHVCRSPKRWSPFFFLSSIGYCLRHPLSVRLCLTEQLARTLYVICALRTRSKISERSASIGVSSNGSIPRALANVFNSI